RIAQSVAEANRGREEKDRVLLIVDGVHGLGVEDPKITALGCDAFATGTHKWMFGPRGTGFVWAKPAVWQRMRPVIPTFTSPDIFEAWEQEHDPQTPEMSRSEEHTSELQSRRDLVCRLLLEKKKKK